MSDEKTTEQATGIDIPPHWDKRVSAAYLRMLGATVEVTANAVGRCEKTIYNWEQEEDRWRAAKREAERRWLDGVTDAARSRLLYSLKRDVKSGDLALKVLERVDDGLVPRQRIDINRLEELTDEELAAIAAGEAPE